MNAFSDRNTQLEREIAALDMLQDYMRAEANHKTPVDEVAGSLLRILARTLVTFAATVQVNGLTKGGGSVDEISDDLMGFLGNAVDIALLEFKALPKGRITVHKNEAN